jgi:hypothetical protein
MQQREDNLADRLSDKTCLEDESLLLTREQLIKAGSAEAISCYLGS